jgi:uncharacterized protein YndB with AHSA1/START domain
MNPVHVEIDIAAPPERVWLTVMDPSRLGQWVTIHRSVKLRSGNPAEHGAQMDQVLQILGVPFKVHWTLEDVEPARRAEWHGRGPALSRALISYILTPTSDGGTRFEYINEFHPPGGALGGVASRVLIGQTPEREAHESLLRLKGVIEGS